MDASQMASGMPQQQGQQPQQPQVTTTPDQTQVGGDIKKVLQVLDMAIEQSVDGQGYVDMQRLIAMWPQIAQQAGINIPFQTVMQLVQSNPQMVSDMIVRHGLSGITMNGQRISAEQLAAQGSGAVGRGRM